VQALRQLLEKRQHA